MKTISADKARVIIYNLNLPKESWLSDFETTGIINKRPDYHNEIDEMLANPHRYLKYEYENIQKLKSYFNKWLPKESVLRHESNVKKFEFDNITYAGEKTEFIITWNELGCLLKIPNSDDVIFSISLEDAKKLAVEILKY